MHPFLSINFWAALMIMPVNPPNPRPAEAKHSASLCWFKLSAVLILGREAWPKSPAEVLKFCKTS